MNSDHLQQHSATAQEALESFLATLLGEETTLQLDAPVETTFGEAGSQAMAYVVVLNTGAASDRFAVLLEPTWLPLFSKAKLGEPIEIGDDGAKDLVRELAAQGYGAVRTSFSATGVALPETTFEIQAPGEQLPADSMPDDLWKISFSAQVGGTTLGGIVLLSAPPAAPPEATPASSARPAPEQPVSVAPASFPDLGGEVIGGDVGNFSLLVEVELEVTVELGRRKLPLADLLSLTTGSVIELEKYVGEPLEVYANGRLIAEGEAVVIDEQFGIRITLLASDRQRTKASL